ncbi:MAG: aldo/keto reductase [Clostridia bacterium]|nr:aldo/keto reductase [Clostridia bacterium]
MKTLNDYTVLSNGVKLPCLGYGTWQSPKEDARKGVKTAIDLGYRHIDTAFAYGNEDAVGEGIRDSGIARDELFVTTKHWITDRGYEKTIKAVETSLSLLGLDYVDLYLIHWPCVEKVTPEWKEINAATWRGFEKMYRDGKIRAIGLSNFEKKHVEALMETAEIAPMVNQIEFHPGYTQMDNVKYSKGFGMAVEAWSPLGSGAVLKDEFLGGIAAKYGKSTAQLCIRFALQNDVIPMPKSVTPERIKQNMEVFDFEITGEDMKAIAAMPELGFSGFRPEEAPADALVNGD